MALQEKIVSIYYLSSTRDDIPRYVGKTIQKLRKRLTLHKSDALNKVDNYRSLNWIRKELKDSFDIEINIIEQISFINFSFEEGFWIEQFRNWGFDLVNHKDGYSENEHWITKKVFTEQALANIKTACRKRKGEGRNPFPEASERNIERLKNTPITPEQRLKGNSTRRETMRNNMEKFGSYFPVRKLQVEYNNKIEIFNSIKHASLILGINYNTLYGAVKRNSNFRKEFKFKFI